MRKGRLISLGVLLGIFMIGLFMMIYSIFIYNAGRGDTGIHFIPYTIALILAWLGIACIVPLIIFSCVRVFNFIREREMKPHRKFFIFGSILLIWGIFILIPRIQWTIQPYFWVYIPIYQPLYYFWNTARNNPYYFVCGPIFGWFLQVSCFIGAALCLKKWKRMKEVYNANE